MNRGRDLAVLIARLVQVACGMLCLIDPWGALRESDSGTWLLFLLASACLVTHVISNHSQNYLRMDIILLFGFLVVHLQSPLMHCLGEDVGSANRLLTDLASKHSTRALQLAVLGLSAWTLGHSFRLRPPVQSRSDLDISAPIAFASIAILAVFVCVAGRDYLTGQIYQVVRAGGHATLSGPAAYVGSFLNVIALTTVLAWVYWQRLTPTHLGRKNGLSAKVIITLVACYLVVFGAAGERGELVQMASAVLLANAATGRGVGLIMCVVMGLAACILMTCLGLARALGWANALDTLQDMSLWNTTSNLAISVRTMFVGLEIVDIRGDYYYGQLWLSNLASIIPFANQIHASITGASPNATSGAEAINTYVYGDEAHTGLGTSMVVDIFMNFGTLGVIIVMTLHGAFTARMQEWVKGRAGIYRFVGAGIFGSLSLYAARSSCVIVVRPMLWGMMICYLALQVSRASRRRGVTNMNVGWQ